VANTTTADIDTFRVAWRRRKSFKVIYKAKISNSQSPSPRKKTSLSRAMQRKTHKEISEQAKIALSELNFRSKRIWQCTSKDFSFLKHFIKKLNFLH